MASSLRLHQQDSVTRVELTGPDGFPRLATSLLEELDREIDRLFADARCQAIVIHGSPQCFATGADIAEVGALTGVTALPFARRGQLLFEKIARGPKPVVAAISGHCLGGGWDLALACWVRLATPDTVFRHPGATLGILTGWGGTQRLPQLLGRARTLELLLQGKALTAQRAADLGLVEEVVPGEQLLPRALERAAQLAARNPSLRT